MKNLSSFLLKAFRLFTFGLVIPSHLWFNAVVKQQMWGFQWWCQALLLTVFEETIGKNLNPGINSILRKIDNKVDPIPISKLLNASQAWYYTPVILAVQGHPHLHDEFEARLCYETLPQKLKIIKINDQMWMGKAYGIWNPLGGSDVIINFKIMWQ